MVAALYVASGGVYFGLPDVEPWNEARDARTYAGPHPVVAHPPCERWGRYWSGGPSARRRFSKGDDEGCFYAALFAVRRFGGVLEHPEASHAWTHFGLLKPPRDGGWVFESARPGLGVATGFTGWTCCVEQGHYGHRARKATWLYAVLPSDVPPPTLKWGPSKGERLDEGFHSPEERRAARAAGQKPRPRLSTRENLSTPLPFRDLLLAIARSTNVPTHTEAAP